jgi:outer membrane protein
VRTRDATLATALILGQLVGCASLQPSSDRGRQDRVPEGLAPASRTVGASDPEGSGIRQVAAEPGKIEAAPIPTTLPPALDEDPDRANSQHSPIDLPAPAETVGESDPTSTFTLEQAITFALRHNPRLRAAHALIGRAGGQEDIAFAPFLPQVDLVGRVGVTSPALAPGGNFGGFGIIFAQGSGPYSFNEATIQIQWALYDFGRTSGRYHQAVFQKQIAGLRYERARETVAFDVALAYQQVLLAGALRAIREEAIRSAEATLKDVRSRREAGVVELDDVLRSEVQLAETRDALVVAREQELDALARLNNFMGRPSSLPLEAVARREQPEFTLSLVQCLEQAASGRREIGVARAAVAAARSGRDAAAADFLPTVTVRSGQGAATGHDIKSGYLGGAAIILDQPLYRGGGRRGALRVADAEVEEATANAQVILDDISLQVTLAYRGVVSSRERIDLARPAIVQARENLRVVGDRYRNGNATPTDIVDAQVALIRAQDRDLGARYEFLAALARLEYAIGQCQGAFLALQASRGPHPAEPATAAVSPSPLDRHPGGSYPDPAGCRGDSRTGNSAPPGPHIRDVRLR